MESHSQRPVTADGPHGFVAHPTAQEARQELAKRPFYKHLRDGLDNELETALLAAMAAPTSAEPRALLKGVVMDLDRRVEYDCLGHGLVTYQDVSKDQADALQRSRDALVRSLLANDYKTAFGAALLCCPITARQLAAASAELRIRDPHAIASEARGILAGALETSFEYGSTAKMAIARSLSTATSLAKRLPKEEPFTPRDYLSGRVQGYDPQPGSRLRSEKPSLLDKVRGIFGRFRRHDAADVPEAVQRKDPEAPQWKEYLSARVQGYEVGATRSNPKRWVARAPPRVYESVNVKSSRTPGLFSRVFAYARG